MKILGLIFLIRRSRLLASSKIVKNKFPKNIKNKMPKFFLIPFVLIVLTSCAYKDRQSEERWYMNGCTFGGLLSKIPGWEEECSCYYYWEEVQGLSSSESEEICIKD